MPSELSIELEDIPDGQALRVELDGRPVALFRRGGEVFAIDAVCPHRRGPLDSVTMDEKGIVTCPWHGWQFDARTGKSPSHPGRVLTYPIERDGNRITVRLPEQLRGQA